MILTGEAQAGSATISMSKSTVLVAYTVVIITGGPFPLMKWEEREKEIQIINHQIIN